MAWQQYIATELGKDVRRERYQILRDAGLSRPEAQRWRHMRRARVQRLLEGQFPLVLAVARPDLVERFCLLPTEYMHRGD